MNWNPFKKAFSGRKTRADDADFEKEMNRLRQMKKDMKKLCKDMTKCNEIEAGYTRCQQRLVADMKTSTTAKHDRIKPLVDIFVRFTDIWHMQARDLRMDQDIVFVEPLKKLKEVVKKMDLYSKQREQKLQEYERQQAKLERQGRKVTGPTPPSSSSSRLEMSQVTGTLTRARSDYERIHDQLMLEVPQLVEVKGSYLDLCLLAVIRAQAIYYSGCADSVSDSIDETMEVDGRAESELCPGWYKKATDLQSTTAQHLASIRTLSIVGNSLMN